MIEQFGGRKAFLTLFILAVCLGVTAWKQDVPANLKDIIEWLFGAFVIGNSFNTAASAVAANRAAKVEIAKIEQGAPSPEPTPEFETQPAAEPTQEPVQSPGPPVWTHQQVQDLANALQLFNAKMDGLAASQGELMNTMSINQRGLSLIIERLTGAKPPGV